MKRFEGLEDRRLREREVENCCVEEGTRSSFRCFLLSSKSHCLGTSWSATVHSTGQKQYSHFCCRECPTQGLDPGSPWLSLLTSNPIGPCPCSGILASIRRAPWFLEVHEPCMPPCQWHPWRLRYALAQFWDQTNPGFRSHFSTLRASDGALIKVISALQIRYPHLCPSRIDTQVRGMWEAYCPTVRNALQSNQPSLEFCVAKVTVVTPVASNGFILRRLGILQGTLLVGIIRGHAAECASIWSWQCCLNRSVPSNSPTYFKALVTLVPLVSRSTGIWDRRIHVDLDHFQCPPCS
jgi:hypothetical protein